MLDCDEIVITRVGNGWQLRPQTFDHSRFHDPRLRGVAMTVGDLTSIICNWALLQLDVEKKAKSK